MVPLAAARRGRDRDGRTYTITVTVFDACGRSDSGRVEVVVPHDRRR